LRRATKGFSPLETRSLFEKAPQKLLMMGLSTSWKNRSLKERFFTFITNNKAEIFDNIEMEHILKSIRHTDKIIGSYIIEFTKLD